MKLGVGGKDADSLTHLEVTSGGEKGLATMGRDTTMASQLFAPL